MPQLNKTHTLYIIIIIKYFFFDKLRYRTYYQSLEQYLFLKNIISMNLLPTNIKG